MSVFKKYASYYDSLYQNKDYEKECDFLSVIFKKYSAKPVHSILDVGCGTGTHDLVLDNRGYTVTGIDLSPEMVDIAKGKIKDKKTQLDFFQGDARNFNLNKKFDTVVSMFAVLSYQAKNEDIISSFKCARQHLDKGSLFIFDIWFGPAVLVQKPSNRFNLLERNGERIVRLTTPDFNLLDQTVDVKYKLFTISGDKILNEADEVHKIRFLFPQETKNYLEQAGFKILEMCPLGELGKVPTENNWDVTIVAEAI
jgi:SAM-dependent methyltransferase